MIDIERTERNRRPASEAWCPGCGLYMLVRRRHRKDCTAKPLEPTDG